MDSLRGRRWPLVGLAVGTIAGAAWGWLAGGTEVGETAAGTALMGMVAGLFAGVLMQAAIRRFRG